MAKLADEIKYWRIKKKNHNKDTFKVSFALTSMADVRLIGGMGRRLEMARKHRKRYKFPKPSPEQGDSQRNFQGQSI